MPQDDRKPRTSLVMPILLITIGGLFLLRNWSPGFEPYQVLKTYWPLILILVGLGKIWDSSRNRAEGQATTGIALGSTLGVVAFVLVIVILLGHYQKTRRHDDPELSPFGRPLPLCKHCPLHSLCSRQSSTLTERFGHKYCQAGIESR